MRSDDSIKKNPNDIFEALASSINFFPHTNEEESHNNQQALENEWQPVYVGAHVCVFVFCVCPCADIQSYHLC